MSADGPEAFSGEWHKSVRLRRQSWLTSSPSFLHEEGKDIVPAGRGGQGKNKINLPFPMLMTLDINKTGRGTHLLFSSNTVFSQNLSFKFLLCLIIKLTEFHVN